MSAQNVYNNIIVSPRENFRGKPYSLWIADWANWLVSNDPDNQKGPVLFLRGEDYRISTPSTPRPQQFRREGHLGAQINEGTAIFFPLIATIAAEGLFPNLTTDELRYNAARYDTDMSSLDSLTATIQNNKVDGGEPHNLIQDFREHRAESPPFKLVVPQYYGVERRIIDQSELSPGTSDAVCDGIWILISGLITQTEPYRIHFEAQGVRGYRIDASYDIYIYAHAHPSPPQMSTISHP
jgi:hypothetical protein